MTLPIVVSFAQSKCICVLTRKEENLSNLNSYVLKFEESIRRITIKYVALYHMVERLNVAKLDSTRVRDPV